MPAGKNMKDKELKLDYLSIGTFVSCGGNLRT